MENKLLKFIPTIILTVLLFTCSSSDEGGNQVGGPTPENVSTISVNTSNTYQSISGFGACNTVFNGVSSFPNESDIQKAYGTGDNELGLSIFRVSIPASQDTWPDIAEVAKYAQDRGAIVFASPWNAPDDMLDPNQTELRKLPEKYDDYVAHLNSFDNFMQTQGVNLHAISIQNEPDIGEWTQWTQTEIENFTRDHAGGINTTVITAESFNFNRSYYNNVLNDDIAVNNVDIVGGHIYGGGLGPFELAEQKGKEIWMTEYLLNDYSGEYDGNPRWNAFTELEKWEQTLEMLETIHEAMESNWNAYTWWYLKRYYSFIGEGQQGTTNGQILKRGFAYSHFSKFIRPGYIRVANNMQFTGDLMSTTYRGNNETVIVIINSNSNSLELDISVDGNTPANGTAYTTTLSSNRDETALIPENDMLIVNIPSLSVVTVVIPD